ncbi:MAG: hypothetical protein ABIG89_01095 [Candidatus Woesearchaeota archaeon]
MKYKKLLILILLALFLISMIVPFVTAAVPGPQDFFEKVGDYILKLFGFEWIKTQSEDAIGAFMRFCIWIIIFTLLYALMTWMMAAVALFNSSSVRITLAIVFATISTIFIPIEVLIAIGQVYSTIASLVMFAIVGGGLVWLYMATNVGGALAINNAIARHGIRVSVILLMWILLNVITTAIGGGI